MSEAQIELVGITRTFQVRRRSGLRRDSRPVTALDDVSFAVGRGEAVGYIGANGAGKSTTIKIIAGILTPTAGHIRTDGLQPVRQRAELARRIGVVFGQRSQLWWDLPLAELFRILAAIHQLPAGRWQLRQDELIEHLDLAGFLQTPVRQLSLGQRMRGEIAAALLHEPVIVVLDEPTVGLDVLSKERLRTFLRHENRVHGRTVLLTTHDMGDIERLCDRVLVVDRGRLAYDGTLPGLVERSGGRRVLVVDLIEPGPALDGVSGTELVAVEAGGMRHRLAFTPGTTSAAQVLVEVAERVELKDVALLEPDIEDVVRRLYLSL